MTVDDRILNRIDALWAKANRTDNPHERDAFMEGALRLMREHAVTDADLARGRGGAVTHERVTLCDTLDRGDARLAVLSLACRIAGSGTRAAAPIERSDGPLWAVIFGFHTEVQVAKRLYGVLYQRAVQEAWDAGWTESDAVASFVLAFVVGAQRKLDHVEFVQRVTAAPGTGLVLAGRSAVVADYVESTGIVVDDPQSLTADDHDAALAGLRAGLQADLDTQDRLRRAT